MKHFDLEQAIATWRQFVRSNSAVTPDDLDELESHLRDEIELRIDRGIDPEAAYRQAKQRMGGIDELTREYPRVYWSKMRSGRGLRRTVGVRLELWTRHVRAALRQLRRSPGYAAINVLGLSVGLAICLLVGRLIVEERSFDRFHEHADRIFRVYTVQERPDRTDMEPGMSLPVGPAVEEGAAGIRHAVRVIDGSALIRAGENRFAESVTFVDEGFFDTFTFPVHGSSPQAALAGRTDMVLSRTAAERMFGESDPVGETVLAQIAGAEQPFTVTAVADDAPANSTIDFDVVMRIENHPVYASDHDNPDSFNHELYVLLEPGVDPADAEREVSRVGRTTLANFAGYLNDRMGYDRETGSALSLGLQPLPEMHLDDRLDSDRQGFPTALLVLSLVALLVLLSGAINFVNLSIGRAAMRAREIGVRRTVGAARSDVGLQFWLETAVLCGVALLIGYALAVIAVPGFNGFIRREMSLNLLSEPTVPVILAGLFIVTSLTAGLYPAWLMARMPPVAALRGRAGGGRGGMLTRLLLTVQFTVVVVFAISLITMGRQLEYLRSADPGFDEEQVVSMLVSGRQSESQITALTDRIASISGVAGVATASNGLGIAPTGGRSTSINTFNAGDVEIAAHLLRVDPGYAPTIGLEFVDGRNFAELDSDAGSIIVNETLYQMVSDQISVGDPLTGYSLVEGKDAVIIGVVRDFHYQAMRDPIRPLIMSPGIGANWTRVFVRLRPDNVRATLAAIDAAWHEIIPEATLVRSFVDEDVDRQYVQEDRQITLAGLAMGVALMIACGGLIGLAVLTTNRRRREIGIRKALGASVPRIVLLLSRQVLLLVAGAFVVAVPLGWLAMNAWLEQFAYRVEVGPGTMVLAGLGVVLVSWLAVSWRTIQAAKTNPVTTLRSE